MYDQYRSVTELTLSADVELHYKGLLLTTSDAAKDVIVLKVKTKNGEEVSLDFVLTAENPNLILPLGITKIFSTSNGTTFPSSSRCYGLN